MKIAGSGPWAGLTVTLQDDKNVALPEYPPEDPTRTDDGMVTKYAEVIDGQRFSFRIARPHPAISSMSAVHLQVFIDGRVVNTTIMPYNCTKFTIDSINERDEATGAVVSKWISFGKPEIQEGGPRMDPAQLDKLGKLELVFQAGTSYTISSTVDNVSVAEPASSLGVKAKKVLGTFVTAEKRGLPPSKRTTSHFDWDNNVPTLKMTFILYRTRAVLEMLGIVESEATRKRKADEEAEAEAEREYQQRLEKAQADRAKAEEEIALLNAQRKKSGVKMEKGAKKEKGFKKEKGAKKEKKAKVKDKEEELDDDVEIIDLT